MRLNTLSLALACLLSVASTTSLRAGLLTNGSFENSTGGLPDDWNPTGNMLVISTQGETAGVHALAFSYGNVPSTGVISQTFSTVGGTIYRLNFDFGKFSIVQPFQFARLDVDVFDGVGFAGTQLLDVTVVDGTPGSGDPNSTDSPDVYSSFQFLFTAMGGNTTLRFADVSDPQVVVGGFDAMLDNVDVTAVGSVPEPLSFTIFAVGGSLLAASAYRRRSRRLSLAVGQAP